MLEKRVSEVAHHAESKSTKGLADIRLEFKEMLKNYAVKNAWVESQREGYTRLAEHLEEQVKKATHPSTIHKCVVIVGKRG